MSATEAGGGGSTRILSQTRGTCPVCIEMVEAHVVEEDGKVYIEKSCPRHGNHRSLISVAPEYYKDLHDYYFDVLPDSLPQRDYILRLTGRCNMACPICLASANDFEEQDLPRETISKLLRGGKRLKIDLMGAEATLRPDLEDIIREARGLGHITALHTNGIRLGEEGYLARLVEAGLDEVHLQFDGFSDAHDLKIRGRAMSGLKEKAVDMLERHRVATDLVVTIVQGSNEDEMVKVLDFSATRPFVKEVFYLGCRPLGRAVGEFAQNSLVPDEVLELLAEKTSGRISRDDIRIFQKLYFAMLALLKVRKCFYIHHYILHRRDGRWVPLAEEMDLKYLEPRLERFRRLFRKSRLLAGGYLGFHAVLAYLRKGSIRPVWDGIVLTLLLLLGFDLSRLKRRPILLGFITACDPWIYDDKVGANCGKGEVSTDLGHHESGALANVSRERLHAKGGK